MHLDAYIRVSAVMGRSGDSFIAPAVQRETIEAYAAANAITIGQWHEELDESGGRDDRPLFLEALARCESGQTGGIIVAKLDRFARSVAGAAVAIRRLEACGAELVSVAERLDTTSPFGRFGRTVMLALAELELERITETWGAARRHAVARGVHVSARVPAGYVRGTDGRLEADPATAPAVSRAFELRAGGASVSAVSRYLTQSRVRGHFQSPAWSISATARLLSNRVYLGEARSGAYRLDDAHDALVDRATFEAVQAARGPTPPRGDGAFPLAGLLRCAGCRYCMTGMTRDGRRVYRCAKRRAAGVCESSAVVMADVVEPYVLEAVVSALDVGGVMFEAEPIDDAGIDAARQAVDAAEVELRTYRDSPGIVTALGAELFAEGLTTRKRDVDEAVARLAELRQRSGAGDFPDAASAAEVFANATSQEVRRHLFAAVDSVFVRAGRGVPIADRCVIFLRGSGPVDLPRRGHTTPLAPLDWPAG